MEAQKPPQRGTNPTSRDEKTMSERKTALDVVMGNETLQKKMITELKYMAIKIIHYKTLRKCTKKINRIDKLWCNFKQCEIYIIRVPREGKRKEKGRTINPQIQKNSNSSTEKKKKLHENTSKSNSSELLIKEKIFKTTREKLHVMYRGTQPLLTSYSIVG